MNAGAGASAAASPAQDRAREPGPGTGRAPVVLQRDEVDGEVGCFVVEHGEARRAVVDLDAFADATAAEAVAHRGARLGRGLARGARGRAHDHTDGEAEREEHARRSRARRGPRWRRPRRRRRRAGPPTAAPMIPPAPRRSSMPPSIDGRPYAMCRMATSATNKRSAPMAMRTVGTSVGVDAALNIGDHLAWPEHRGRCRRHPGTPAGAARAAGWRTRSTRRGPRRAHGRRWRRCRRRGRCPPGRRGRR